MSHKLEISLNEDLLKSIMELVDNYIGYDEEKGRLHNILIASSIISGPLLSQDNITKDKILSEIRNKYDSISKMLDELPNIH